MWRLCKEAMRSLDADSVGLALSVTAVKCKKVVSARTLPDARKYSLYGLVLTVCVRISDSVRVQRTTADMQGKNAILSLGKGIVLSGNLK